MIININNIITEIASKTVQDELCQCIIFLLLGECALQHIGGSHSGH